MKTHSVIASHQPWVSPLWGRILRASLLVVALLVAVSASASPLAEQIQKELDASPFLASQHLKMSVLAERQGSVTLELSEGPQILRDLLRRGYDLNGSAFLEMNLEPDVVQALRSLKRMVRVVKGMEGVREISLTGAITHSAPPAEPRSNKPNHQAGPTPLMEQIQEKLDASPFLPPHKVKIRVLDEYNGLISLEVTDGPKKLRDLFRKGYELNGSALAEAKLEPDVIKALRSVKRTLAIIKGLEGVREISLTGAINTMRDRAENFYDEATLKMNPNDSTVGQDALELLIKSAKLGFLRAQTDLARIYEKGVDLIPDEERAVFWLRQAAEQGDPPSQFQLAARYSKGHGVNKDYKEALEWYQKAAAQDFDPDIQTGSQIALASLLATCPVEHLRDGNEAIEYAKKAVAAAPNGEALESLATAYARCGQFEEAVEQERKWIQQLENSPCLAQEEKENLRANAKYRLQLFLQHQPYTSEN